MSDIDLQSRPRLSPRVRLQIDTVRQEPVLLFPEGLLALNPTAHEIITRCDGHNTVEMIIELLGDEFEVTEEILRQDVLATLADLQQRNLITFQP
jgi:pyrroloquinoline quinone biosynthesis protein D